MSVLCSSGLHIVDMFPVIDFFFFHSKPKLMKSECMNVFLMQNVEVGTSAPSVYSDKTFKHQMENS